MDKFFEIFTLLTGILYLILEIRQHNLMWVVGILTSLAAMWVFFSQDLYASFGLNCYYLVVSFVGLWQWRKDSLRSKAAAASAAVGGCAGSAEAAPAAAPAVRLRSLTWKVVLLSLLVGVVAVLGFGYLAKFLGDPMSWLDVSVAVLSAIATWWLARSYKEQWLLWIIADTMSTALCISQKLWWMTALYLAYTVSAVYGYYHWKKHGQSIE